MDFFEQANEHVRELNANERKIFEYVVRNVDRVKEMQIRTLAAECFVSTTTIMRFAKKLGFSGYREFSDALRVASHAAAQSQLPSVLMRQTYGEEYLKNIIESVRVLTEGKVDLFRRALAGNPRIFCFGTGLDGEIARYAYRLLSSLGYRAACPMEAFERKASVERMEDGDVLYLFALTGEDEETLDFVERARLRCKPTIMTVTQSANNTLQSLSDVDLYVFTDKITVRDENLSSRSSMLALVELLAHGLLKGEK